jgi:hypothetical protein
MKDINCIYITTVPLRLPYTFKTLKQFTLMGTREEQEPQDLRSVALTAVGPTTRDNIMRENMAQSVATITDKSTSQSFLSHFIASPEDLQEVSELLPFLERRTLRKNIMRSFC